METATSPKFAAIVLTDLIEHISQPLDLLRKLASSLTAQGRLIIVTGDGNLARLPPGPDAILVLSQRRTPLHAYAQTRGIHLLGAQSGFGRMENDEPYDLSFREQLVQHLQNFVYWEFRGHTFLARFVLRFLP